MLNGLLNALKIQRTGQGVTAYTAVHQLHSVVKCHGQPNTQELSVQFVQTLIRLHFDLYSTHLSM